MKTVALNNRTAVRSFFVLAALAGLYYFRRNGGTLSSLTARGTDAIGAARTWVNKVAPSVAEQASSLTGSASAKSMSASSKRAGSQSISSSAQI